MLTGLMVSWFISGRQPYYTDYANMNRMIIYLSDLAATNRQPAFICGTALMSIFIVWGVYEEFKLRDKNAPYLLPYYSRVTKWMQISLIIVITLSSFCILMVSCIKVTKNLKVHILFLGCFIGFDVVFAFINVFLKMIYHYHYRQRYFAISFAITFLWAACTIVVISLFGVFILIAIDQGNASYFYGYSGVMEWSACYLYGALFIILSVDMTRPRADALVMAEFRKCSRVAPSTASTTLADNSDILDLEDREMTQTIL